MRNIISLLLLIISVSAFPQTNNDKYSKTYILDKSCSIQADGKKKMNENPYKIILIGEDKITFYDKLESAQLVIKWENWIPYGDDGRLYYSRHNNHKVFIDNTDNTISIISTNLVYTSKIDLVKSDSLRRELKIK